MTVPAMDGEASRLVADLVEASAIGVAVVDGGGRWVYANATARRLARSRGREDLDLLLAEESVHVTRWPFTSAGQDFTAMSFHESGRVERQLRQVAAFAGTASWIACRRPLQDVLDRVAAEARNATGAAACSVFLFEPDALHLRLVGAAGHAGDYTSRLMHSVDLGAPLASIDAFRTGRPAKRSRLHEMTGVDPRYEPLEASGEAGDWDEIVAVPAVIQGQCVGVLTSFFRAGQNPTDDDMTFLSALADQTATAIDNANLVAELQSAAAAAERHDLAIDLHDTVSQALFSVIMQSRSLAMRARQAEQWDDSVMLRAISQLEATAEQMQREIRGFLRQMRADDAPLQSLAEDLTSLVGQLARGASPKLRLDLPDSGLPALDTPARRELIRVVREAVTNSVRHGSASQIIIRVKTTATELEVEVADDGVGFDPSQQVPGHLGLDSMSLRTARIGGTLGIESSAQGTVVRVRLSLLSRRLGGEG